VDTRLATLSEIEAAVWRELAAAPTDKQHPWRTPVLATVEGELADARTIVLRETDVAQQTLLLYTDERAGKVDQLQRHPLGTLVMWSPRLSWQLRCRVSLSLERSGLAVSSRWARIKLSPSAQDYLSPLPPGQPLEGGPPPAPERGSREFFAVINAQVVSIDWLELHAQGHRRARFEGGTARWLQP